MLGIVPIENGDEELQLRNHPRQVVGCGGDKGLDVQIPVAVNDAVAHP